MTNDPQILRNLVDLLTTGGIYQAHSSCWFIKDVVLGVLVEVDLDQIFEVLLDLWVVEVEDVEKFRMIALDAIELVEVASVGLNADVVQLLDYYADMRCSTSPLRVL